MPIYEYVCENCGDSFDFLQKVDEPAKKKCPRCDTKSLKRQISVSSFQLKGDGWYATDFRNKDTPKKDKKTENKDSTDKNK